MEETIIVNVNVAPSPSASVAWYVMAYSPSMVGLPLNVRVGASNLSPGMSGIKLYVKAPSPPLARGSSHVYSRLGSSADAAIVSVPKLG